MAVNTQTDLTRDNMAKRLKSSAKRNYRPMREQGRLHMLTGLDREEAALKRKAAK